MTARIATVDDAQVVAALLDAFNREFATPSPGASVLTDRLRIHLAGGPFAVLDGDPPVAVALVTVTGKMELFVQMKVFAADVKPTGTEPKSAEVGVMVGALPLLLRLKSENSSSFSCGVMLLSTHSV